MVEEEAEIEAAAAVVKKAPPTPTATAPPPTAVPPPTEASPPTQSSAATAGTFPQFEGVWRSLYAERTDREKMIKCAKTRRERVFTSFSLRPSVSCCRCYLWNPQFGPPQYQRHREGREVVKRCIFCLFLQNTQDKHKKQNKLRWRVVSISDQIKMDQKRMQFRGCAGCDGGWYCSQTR